jgi:two-component system sensor histidine kinase PilS (NtrC family)
VTDRGASRPDRPAADDGGNADTSWFGAFSLDQDAQDPDPPPGSSKPNATTASTASSPNPSTSRRSRSKRDGRTRVDSRFLTEQALRQGSEPSTFLRIYRTFIGARATLSLILVAVQLMTAIVGNSLSPWSLTACLGYALTTWSVWWLGPPTKQTTDRATGTLRRRHWLATIGVDLIAFAGLHALAPSANLNYQAFLVLPVLMSGILTPRLSALAVTATATFVLLGVAWWNGVDNGNLASLMTQAGLFGAALFAISVLCGELASRLASEELTAKGSMELARQQAQLNRLVIDEMQDGVLVVDRRGRVRAANPAARRMLVAAGNAPTAPFQLRGIADWAPLVQAVEQAFSEGLWPEGGRDIALPLSTSTGGVALRELRLRVRFTRRSDAQAAEDLCVLFIEEMRNVHARLRQEKLAAMGRMSAGIAHEIRNPLAAIAQANALLAEDAQPGTQQRLTTMVADNVTRLKRIVDDVLAVAPGVRQEAPAIECIPLVTGCCAEWLHTAPLPPERAAPGEHCVLQVTLPPALSTQAAWRVRFDGEHLRRVLINLLDNAWRHCSQTPGAIHLMLQVEQHAERPSLIHISVLSDGAPVPPEVEQSLFEPFFSTRSRGTGLGLYICRELCERYGARIDYGQHGPESRHRNEFRLTLRSEAPL